MKSIKIFSFLLIIVCFCIFIYVRCSESYDIIVHNKIVDNVFSVPDDSEYLGYVYIPKFDVKRLIKYGTDSSILDSGFVGMHEFSRDLSSSSLIVLAGHNISSVFSCLHDLSIDDVLYIKNYFVDRKFYVYDMRIVSEYDMSYFYERYNELMLITCDRPGYRLVVFLREVL